LNVQGAHLSFAPTSPLRVPVLVLASASPRRAELLRALGVPFLLAPFFGEEPRPDADDGAQPAHWVKSLARFKAERSCWPEDASTLLLTADTIVCHDGQILNKPRDESEAIQMLHTLRGRTHTVYTGVCLRDRESGEYSTAHEATHVTFGDVSDAWIEKYVATGEPMDKAGSYAAQGKGALLVQNIEGDFWNVVGLPLFRVAQMLRDAGVAIEDYWNKSSSPPEKS
jgi:septum formation protein